jgi:hypothetical protein
MLVRVATTHPVHTAGPGGLYSINLIPSAFTGPPNNSWFGGTRKPISQRVSKALFHTELADRYLGHRLDMCQGTSQTLSECPRRGQ